MTACQPAGPPARFTQGDTLRWSVPAGAYPPADGWAWSTLLLAGAVKVTATGSPSADGASVEFVVTTALSTTFPPGPLAWQTHTAKDPDGYVLAAGRSLVLPNLATAPPGFSPLTPAERILAAITATLEGTATRDESQMIVDGLQIAFRSITELLKLRDRYAQIVADEQAALNPNPCGGNRRKVLVRFVPP